MADKVGAGGVVNDPSVAQPTPPFEDLRNGN